MTAGRSAGTEQGQGREVCVCGHGIQLHWSDGLTLACPAYFSCGCQDYKPSPSVPPARDSGRDEAREAFRRWWAEPASYLDYETAFRAGYEAALLRDGTTT